MSSAHGTTMSSHRRRSRGCENACCYATRENEFFRVHNFVPFLKIEPVRIWKVSPFPHLKGNAVVTIPMQCSNSAGPLPVVTARINRFIAEDSKGPYPDME